MWCEFCEDVSVLGLESFWEIYSNGWAFFSLITRAFIVTIDENLEYLAVKVKQLIKLLVSDASLYAENES